MYQKWEIKKKAKEKKKIKKKKIKRNQSCTPLHIFAATLFNASTPKVMLSTEEGKKENGKQDPVCS